MRNKLAYLTAALSASVLALSFFVSATSAGILQGTAEQRARKECRAKCVRESGECKRNNPIKGDPGCRDTELSCLAACDNPN